MKHDLKAIDLLAQAFMGMSNKRALAKLRVCSEGDCDATLEHVQRLVKQGHFELTPLTDLLEQRLKQIKFAKPKE